MGKRKIKIKGLERKLREILYPLIKERDGNTCISCGKTISKKGDWHAGHFAKAELCNVIYRYDERNINSQCSYCNRWRDGHFIEYEKAMIRKYGQEVVDEIKENYRKPLPMDLTVRDYLEQKIMYYKGQKKLKDLSKSKLVDKFE